MFLPVPRRWREGTGDSVTGAECKRTHTHTRTQAQSANTDTQTSRGFVVLCGFVFLQAQQCLVCLNQRVKHVCCVAPACLRWTHALIKAPIRSHCTLFTVSLKSVIYF